MRLKTPPYAAAHVKAEAAGYAPATGVVFIFDGWPRKQLLEREEFTGAWRAVVPPDEDPAAYNWQWCAGFDTCIVSPGGRAIRIAWALQNAHAHVSLLVVGADGFQILRGTP